MAMMSWMRQSSRYFLAFVVVTFIASLAYFGATQDRSSAYAVATVNGEEIPAAAYERAYRSMVEQYRQMLKERFSEELLRTLRVPEQVVDRLVSDRLVEQRATAEGIGISDEELGEEITRIRAFQDGAGRFSREQYVRVLSRAQMTPAVFETELRSELLQRKLRALVADGVKVSEAEVRQQWESRNERVRAAYIVVTTEPFLATAEASDAEIEAYYQAHPGDFTRPERRRVLVALLPGASVPAPPVTGADIEAAYKERLDQFVQPERRKVAHILVRVPNVGGSEAEDKARAKAEEALRRVRAGADFAQVAREVSEDTGTARQGGELGLVAPGEVVPQFEQAVFALKPGELAGPVRTPFGYHVVKVLEVVPGSRKELKEVAGTLRVTLAAEGQLRALRAKAEDAQRALLVAPDFGAEARRRGLNVREVGPFARSDAVEGVGRVAEATNAIFTLAQDGVSAPVKVPEGYAIFRLLEREEPRLLPLGEVRSSVLLAVRRQKAQQAVEAKARQLAEAVRAGEEPRVLAKREGLTAAETPAFSRAQPLPDQELAAVVAPVALELPAGAVGGPATGARGVYVVKVLGRERPDVAGFEPARGMLEKELLESKRAQAWQGWVAGLRAAAKVEINRKILPQP